MSNLKQEISSQIRLLAENELNKQKVFVPGVSPVPASGAMLFPEDIEELVDTVLQFWYTEWIKCRKFKKALCEVTGKKHCVLVNSGSSASLIALTALLKGSYKPFVVTTALGFPTTVYPIYQNGKTPIFIDIDPKTLSPNWEQYRDLYKRHEKDISGIIFAHTLGFPSSITDFGDIFRIEDVCDALGARVEILDEYHHVGKFADAMTLSFFPAHQICAGEGGAILTDDYDLYELMNKLTSWGRDCTCLPGMNNTCGKRFEGGWAGKEWKKLPKGWDHKYTFTELGYNLKMTEFQAALGYSQLKHLDYFVEKRMQNFSFLTFHLYKRYELLDTIELQNWQMPSPFGFPIMVKENTVFTAQDLIQHLEKDKIHTRRFFGGNLIRQPVFDSLQYVYQDLSGTDYLMDNAFYVGCHPSLTKAHLDWIIESIHNFFKGKKLI